MKQNRLVNVKLNEVSLVDAPANPNAKVLFYKAADGVQDPSDTGEAQMDIEELQAKLAEQEAQMAEMTAKMEAQSSDLEAATKAADQHKADLEGLMAALEEFGLELQKSEQGLKIEKKAEIEMIEVEGEMVAKSAIPAPVLKHLEAKQAEIEELRKQKELDELYKRAEESFPNLAGGPEAKAALLKAIEGIDGSDERDAVTKALKAADASVAKMFKEEGHSSSESGSSTPASKLEALVKKYKEEHGVSDSIAFSEVTKTKEGKELLLATRSGDK